MKLVAMAVALSLAGVAPGCDRRPAKPPTPKVDARSASGGGVGPESAFAAGTTRNVRML